MTKYNIQLFSVRKSFEKDIKGTLKALSEMGYDGVEFYDGSFDIIEHENLKELLDFYGLTPVSVHIGYEKLLSNIDFYIDYLKKIECNMVVCPYCNPQDKSQADEIAKNFEMFSEKLIMHSISFGYHNHQNEFKIKVGEQTIFDYMIEKSGMLILTELDLGHIAAAGENAEEYIRKYAGRVTYLHLKQFEEKSGDFKVTTLENGIVDIKKCIEVGKLMGCEYFIVEQDNITNSELDDAKANIDFLKGLKL